MPWQMLPLFAATAGAEEPDSWQEGALWMRDARAVINGAWVERLDAIPPGTDLEGRPYITIVRLAVDAEGNTVEVVVTRQSGADVLDQAVVEAVRSVHLPPPPTDAVLGGRYIASGLLFQVTPTPPPERVVIPPVQSSEIEVVEPVSNGLGPEQSQTEKQADNNAS